MSKPNDINNLSKGFKPTLISANSYYPFGMEMPGKSFSSDEYRYGFNGRECVYGLV